ncbi:MAG: tetratricopeptide repeat protein [Planctomycetota bacterium]
MAILFAGLCDVPQLPPAELRDWLDAAYTRLRGAVESRGGTIDKFIGETVMAVFGAPVAHEDDALRAVRAALAMREESGATPLRIGVNFGEILWGQVAGEPPTAMGDVVNVARRLEEAAAAGEVLVEAAVERLTHRVIRFRSLEPMRVKGREEQVRAFAAEGPLGGETSIRHGPGRETPLVGRDIERARLQAAWESGRGAFVVVVGEAGVGKTRLVADFRVAIRRQGGARVATGRALEEARLPMAPFAEMARAETTGPIVLALAESMADAVPDPVDRENFAHLISLSIGVAVPDARVRAIDPARLIDETHHAWAVWATSRGPALLCLEDLQWADDAALALLESLPRAASGSPFMVVATARPGARLPAGFERLDLADLVPEAALRLAANTLGAPLSPALRDFLVAQSGGNPFYVEELARFLKDERLVAGVPLDLSGPAGKIPAGLRGLLVARLDAMPAESREAMKAASVLGRAFWPGLLGELLARDPAGSIREASRRDMIGAQRHSLLPGEAQYLFRHALLRDAAYSLLPKKDRARLHAVAADRLLARSGGRAIRVLAAGHRENSGDATAAAGLWEEASVEAIGDGAPAEALAHAREATRAAGPRPASVLATAEALLSLARPAEALVEAERAGDPSTLPPDQRAQALNIAARVRGALGQYREAADGARQLAQAAPEGRWRVVAQIALAGALMRLGDWEGSLRETGRGQEMLAAEPEFAASRAGRRLAASLYVALSNVHVHRGAVGESLDACRKALVEARGGADLACEAAAFNNMGNALRALGRADEALAAYRASLEIDRRTGDRAGIASGLNNVGNIHRARGELDAAEGPFRQALALRREIGDQAGVAACLGNLGNLEGQRGRTGPSLGWYEEGLALARKSGDRPATAALLNNLAWARGELGDLSGALADSEESISIRRETSECRGLSSSLANLARILCRRGEPQRALAAIEESLALARATGAGPRESRALLERGRIRKTLGLADEALGDFHEALRIARQSESAEDIENAERALREP